MIARKLVVWIGFTAALISLTTAAAVTPLKIGFMGPLVASHGYPATDLETHGPAVSLAVQDANTKGLLRSFNVTVVWRDDHCKPGPGLSAAIELKEDERVDMIAGSFCSPVVDFAGLYFAHYNIPVFTHGATDRALADKDAYQTLVRVGPNYNYYGEAFVEIFKRFQWTRAVMLAKPTRTCQYGATDIDEAFYENGLTVAEWIRIDDSRVVTDEQIDVYLTKLRKQAKVMIMCLSRPLMKRILLRAWRSGMTQNGEYVFFNFAMMPSDSIYMPWGDTSQDDFEEVKMAYRSYRTLTMAPLSGPDVDAFRQAVLDRLAYRPWDGLTPYGPGAIYSLMLYDAVYLYLTLVNETATAGQDFRDARLLLNKARGKVFRGKSGVIHLDDKADRIPEFMLWHLVPGDDQFTAWTPVRLAETETMETIITSHWYTENNQVPGDIDTGDNSGSNPVLRPSTLPVFLLFWIMYR